METEPSSPEDRATRRPGDEPRPSWPRILAITGPCGAVGIASGIVLGSAVAPPETVAYIAAALFVAVLALAIR